MDCKDAIISYTIVVKTWVYWYGLLVTVYTRIDHLCWLFSPSKPNPWAKNSGATFFNNYSVISWAIFKLFVQFTDLMAWRRHKCVTSHVTKLRLRQCYLQLETGSLNRPLSAVYLIEPVVRKFRRKWFRVRLFQFFLGNYFISLLAKTIFCVSKAFDQNVIFKTQYI